MPFYKRDNEELLIAPNFVYGPGFELSAETRADHTYPVDGWYWFDTLDIAMTELKTPVEVNEVSRFQARVALYLGGHLSRIEEIMQNPDTPVLVRLAWQDAQVFERGSQSVALLAAMIPLTDAQVDELFVVANGIQG